MLHVHEVEPSTLMPLFFLDSFFFLDESHSCFIKLFYKNYFISGYLGVKDSWCS